MLPSRPRGVDPIISCTEREVIPIDEEISQKIPGIDFNLRNWICQNCSCYDYPEQILSHDNCRLLSKEEKSTLESILNSYMRIEEREDDDATAENSQMDQVLEYMKFEAKVLPLITCMTQSLDDSVAEQRVTRENYIEELCNMTEDGKLLYYDETGSPIIKFDEINKYKIDLVGILGKKYNVICFLRNRLKEQSMKLLEETFDKEGSGLYLMLPKSVSAAETNEGYLYFYSTNDEDYHCMNSQSRAVHFIRYMTELTRNIILLLDNKDKKLLSFKPESKSGSSRRVRSYQITHQEKEEKKSKVSQLGKIPIPSEDDCEKKIYCSSNSLVVALIKNPNEMQRQIGIYEFHKFFSLKEFTDSSCISESFKRDYLNHYHKKEFDRLQKEVFEIKRFWKQKNDVIFKMEEFAQWIQIMRNYFAATYSILKKFSDLQKTNETSWASFWSNGCQNIESTDFKSEEISTEIVSFFERTLKPYFYSISSIILLYTLNYPVPSPTFNISFQQLFDEAQRANVFPGSVQFEFKKSVMNTKLDENDKNVCKLYRDKVGDMKSKSSEHYMLLQNKIQKMLEALKDSFQKRQVADQEIRLLRDCFVKASEASSQTSHNRDGKKHITKIKHVSEMRYQIEYQFYESKMSLKLFKLQLSEILSEESGTSTCKDAVGTLNFVKHQECDIEQADIQNIFIIDSLLTLLVCNSKDGHSFFKIHNQSTQKKLQAPNFADQFHIAISTPLRDICVWCQGNHTW